MEQQAEGMIAVGYMLLGSVLTILVSVIGTIVNAYINARWRRYNHMQEIIAQKKIDANQHAYIHMKMVESLLIQGTPEEIKKERDDNETWFFSNALFLPSQFPDKYFTLRSGIEIVLRHQKMLNKGIEPKRLSAEEEKLHKLAKELVGIIYKDMKIKYIKAKPFKCKAQNEKNT